VYLLGFCVQDTYAESFRNGDIKTEQGLYDLMGAITSQAGMFPYVRSSCPDIEVSLRSNSAESSTNPTKDKEAFVFVINHESPVQEVRVSLFDVGFPIKTITDLADGSSVSFTTVSSGVEFTTTLPAGYETRLFRVR
jgi:hypothetical protein